MGLKQFCFGLRALPFKKAVGMREGTSSPLLFYTEELFNSLYYNSGPVLAIFWGA